MERREQDDEVVIRALAALRNLCYKGTPVGQNPAGELPEVHLAFPQWLAEQCIYRDRWWTPVTDLNHDFCEWGARRDCDATTFRALLEGAGFYIEAVNSIQWVHGLVLTRYAEGWS